ncbi:MAG: peptide synthase [Planctomycetota bacterium]|nr:MAG: peptide synthase [Planctomycetota bacterium]
MSENRNIARRLQQSALAAPDQDAVLQPLGRRPSGTTAYSHVSFAELEERSNRLARGLARRGVVCGTKLVLFVPFSVEFIELTFALFKAGAVVVLIDPGMGRANIFRCLEEVEPDGFVAIPRVQAIRCLMRSRFRSARLNVTVGRRWFWGGATYDSLMRDGDELWKPVEADATEPAAIIFTSGSTGPPKGVLYEHGMFDAQVDLIRDRYGIEPGEIDLPGFPLFGLFNAAMQVTTVIPEMDPTRPADVDPRKIVRAIEEQQVTQAFGSPAFWNRVGRYCEEEEIELPTLRRALSAGGPVPGHVLERMSRALTGKGADFHTPYGATESLPVASISASEVFAKTADATRRGAGTCVGRTFPGVDVRIIEVTDGPLGAIDQARELPPGEIGEIVVRGPSVTREYFRRPDATRMAKIPDGETIWHRIGDVGYLDDDGLLWFCGRKAHIVETEAGRMYTVCCEAIFNEHPGIYRTALVGVGPKPRQKPVIIAEPEAGQFPTDPADAERVRRELRALGAKNPLTERIETFLLHESLPVDTRHNVKINRDALAAWASMRLER